MQFKTEVGKSFGFTTQIKDLTVVSKPNYLYLTSTIYPTELIEELYTKSINVGGRSNTADDLGVYRFNQDGTKPSISQITGTLKVALKVYNYSRNEEEIDKVNLNVSNISAILREVLIQYQIKEDNITSSVSGISGVLRTVLIAYDYYGIENINSVVNKLTAIYTSVQNSYEVFVKGNNEVYKYPNTLRRMLLRATAETLLETTSTELTDYDLVFSTPFSEVDSKNVIIIFGAKSVPKEPEVIVNEYTTSALDFEDGIIDQIPTTIWNIDGTGTVQSVNKIFGKNSYAAQNYPGGLLTNTDVITGNSTPFNIEFYALLKTSNSGNFPLLYKNYNGGMGEQGFYVGGDGLIRYHTYRGGWLGYYANKKIRLNEINKYNITYDGSAIRMLIDDKLEFIIGSPYGIETSQHREPLSFFKRHVPGYDVYSEYTMGLIDNINIFDNTSGSTRTKDINENYLVCDLQFEGQTNSIITLVDNAPSNPTWYFSGNSPTSYIYYRENSGRFLTGVSHFYKTYYNNAVIKSDNVDLNFGTNDWTITFEFIKESDTQYCNLISVAASNYITDAAKLFYFCVMGSTYTGITNLRNKLAFFNEFNLGQESIKNSVIENPYATPNVLVSRTTIQVGVAYKADIVFKDGIMNLYLNGRYDTSIPFTMPIDLAPQGLGISVGGVPFSNEAGLIGSINYIKIYKGKAIYPESSFGKIRLNFDNNLIDSYSNSLWNNYGATFDYINSIKGYSLNLTDTPYIETTANDFLNYENKNFRIEFDANKRTSSRSYSSWLCPSNGLYPSQWCELSQWYDNQQVFQNLSSTNLNTNGATLKLNTWYKWGLCRSNNTVFLKANDVITGATNYTSSMTVNFNNGGYTRISGKDTNIMDGNMDNFYSYKEDLVNLNTTTYKSNNNTNVLFNTYKGYLEQSYSSYTSSYDESILLRYLHVFNDSPNVKDFIIEAEIFLSTSDYLFRLHTNTKDFSLIKEDKLGYSIYCYNNTVMLGKGSNSLTEGWVTVGSQNILSSLRDNSFHKFKVIKNGDTIRLYIDDNLYLGVSDSSHSNVSSGIAIGGNNHNGTGSFSVNIKNIKISNLDGKELYYKDWISTFSEVIDKPAVHLPLETDIINRGYNNLTINELGGISSQTVNGKKAFKFENDKYITINTNNIFNLGTYTDFYIEVDFLIPVLHNTGFGHTIINGNGLTNLNSLWLNITPNITTNNTTRSVCLTIRNPLGENYNNFETSNLININEWNNLKFYRKGNILTLELNKIKTVFNNFNFPIDFASVSTYLGNTYGTENNANLDGYLSNFKLFVGTSEIPSTYNDKKVLNLDFKPTNKSYLFKDNNNKCIIHPVNIIQRDYQDSQYCCYFNSDSQSLELGKNNLLNFGNDDFIIEIIFKKSTSNGWRMLFCDNAESTNFIDIGDTNFLAIKMGGVRYDTPANSIIDGVITKILIQVSNSILTVKINDQQVTLDGQLTQPVNNVNFNLNNNTFIGKYYTNTEFFKGYIYSIKVLRNTTDLSLLEEEDNGGEVGNPLDLILQNVSTITNPEPGSFVNVSGRIYNPLTPPTVVAKINGISISPSDITTSERANGDYDLNIKLLSDDLLLNNSLEVTVTDGVYTETRTTPINIIRDKVLDLNSLDSFGTYWGQANESSKVSVRNFNDEEMMYFNGDSALVSNNTSFFLGLDKFTIELDFVMNTNPSGSGFHLISQGIVYNLTNFYSLILNSDLSISFVTDKASPGNSLNLRTASGIFSLNTKYRVSVTRDSDYTTRIFLNGVKVAERVINTNLGYSNQSSYENNVYVFLGREGTLYNNNSNIHFKGFMKNVSIRKGECAYTSDYSVEEYTRGILTKSLLTFSESDGSFVTKEDSFNRNITWNNTGTTVTNHELVFNGNQNRLTSSSNSMYNFGINNWTIDCIFTPSQILSESVLLDLRTSANSFNGIMVRQSSSDPTSLTINIGSSTDTQSYSYTVTTGVNSLKANQQAKLKIVRASGQIVIFLNDLETNRINVGTTTFVTNTSVCLGNNLSYNRGFNGKIKQFRIINGTATNVYPVPIKSGEILT